MVQDLIHLGCPPQKTHILKFPSFQQVPEHLINHFMRGYFDGDGCIYVNPKKSGTNLFDVVGNHDFIASYKKTMFTKIGKASEVKLRKCNCNGNIVALDLGGNQQLRKIYNFLYKDATIYLKRKKEKFEIIIGRLKTSSQKSLENESGIKLGNRKVS